MSPARTVLLVAEREVRQRLRSRLFVVTTLVLAGLLTLLSAAPAVLGAIDLAAPDTEATAPRGPLAVAVAGELSGAERAALDGALGPVDLLEVEDVGAVRDLLAAEDGAVDLGIEAGERVLVPPTTGMFQLLPPEASRAAEALALARALDADGEADLVARVLEVDPLPVDQVGADDPSEAAGSLIAANLGVVFLFGVLIMYASMIINGVIEEKGSRVVELLVETVPVRQLMAGKVLGLGLVGLGQTLMLFAPPVVVLLTTSSELVPAGVGSMAAWLVLWFLLGYGLYAVVAAGLGSLVSRPEEAQAVLTPANLLMITGYFIGFAAINAPDAGFARVAALVPFSAPYAMLVRQTLGTPAGWEVLTAIVLTAATIVLLTLVSARLYEGGILRVGARVRLSDAWRSARR
jgi:ABC-2 type transport system permease protein